MANKTVILAGVGTVFVFVIFLSSSSFISSYGYARAATVPASSSLSTVKCMASFGCDVAGYGAMAANGAVTRVSSSITLPRITCSKNQKEGEFTNFDVQIDGIRGSASENDIAYAGLQVYCTAGTFTWSAVYGANNATYSLSMGSEFLGAKAGDKVSMSVMVSGTNVFFAVADQTHKASFSGNGIVEGLEQNSASCVVTVFASYPDLNYLLVNFGTVKYEKCQATISGDTRGIGGFGSSNLVEYVLYNSAGTKMLARTSSLAKEENFSIKFQRSS